MPELGLRRTAGGQVLGRRLCHPYPRMQVESMSYRRGFIGGLLNPVTGQVST